MDCLSQQYSSDLREEGTSGDLKEGVRIITDIQACSRDLNLDSTEQEEIHYLTETHTIPSQKSTG
jgi:hypothetical protein